MVNHHFLRYLGNCSFEFIPQGQAGNRAYYVEMLKPLREAVRRKGPEFGPTIAFFTMTMHHLTKRSLPRSF
jgi:hypothetical protein